jgi:alkylation response protein AidB-like acyl-CoA dehydrogenase
MLEGAFVPDKYIARILPAGGADYYVVAMFAWALMGFANTYYGIAQRAMDLALPGLKNKTSIAVSRSMAYHPEIQHMVAEMALAFDPIGPHLDRIAEDWSNGVDHGAAWPAKIVSAKYHAVEACWRIVDKAMEVSGGAGMFRANELERLFRDALRPFSPGEHLPRARDRRQDGARHRPRRAAALGLTLPRSRRRRTERRRCARRCSSARPLTDRLDH